MNHVGIHVQSDPHTEQQHQKMSGRNLIELEDEVNNSSQNEHSEFYQINLSMSSSSLTHGNENLEHFRERKHGDSIRISSNHDASPLLPKQQRVETSNWNQLNISLFFVYFFSTISTTVPISLTPTIVGDTVSMNQSDYGDDDVEYSIYAYFHNQNYTSLSSRIISNAILGCALGKFLNGHLGDVFGARRISCTYSILSAISLLVLSFSYSSFSILFSSAAVEFFQGVQWPCIITILASHYNPEAIKTTSSSSNNKDNRDTSDQENKKKDLIERQKQNSYLGGVYVTSLASRLASLVSMPLCPFLLKTTPYGWRNIVRFGALCSCMAFLTCYIFVSDSPTRKHHPQNPPRVSSYESYLEVPSDYDKRNKRNTKIIYLIHVKTALTYMKELTSSVIIHTVFPSIKSVVWNGTFWIVAVAHAGGSMVKSSERILGLYFRDTSSGTIGEDQTGSLVVFLSFGLLFGLLFMGGIFSSTRNEESRRKLVMILYAVTVVTCYLLSLFGIAWVRKIVNSPAIVTMFQVLATFFMGVGIAVQYYQITPIVAAGFGKYKGMYSAYTEGVALLISSVVLKLVGDAVGRGNPSGNGWAYVWAFIALLVIFCGVVMVEFMDHFFCKRGAWNRTISERNLHDKGNVKKGTDFLRRRTTESSPSKNQSPVNKSIFGMDRRFYLPLSFDLDCDIKQSFSFRGKKKDKSNPTEGNQEHQMQDDTYTGFQEILSSPPKLDKFLRNELLQQSPRERLESLMLQDENQTCADCPNILPRWASIIFSSNHNNDSLTQNNDCAMPMGCFICHECVAFHRNLGVHICFVRSVDHDEWKENEVEAMERGGNQKVNHIYEAELTQFKNDKPSGQSSNTWVRERFISNKYQKRKYLSRDVGRLDKFSSCSGPIQHEDNSMLNSHPFSNDLLDSSESSSSSSSSSSGNSDSDSDKSGDVESQIELSIPQKRPSSTSSLVSSSSSNTSSYPLDMNIFLETTRL